MESITNLNIVDIKKTVHEGISEERKNRKVYSSHIFMKGWEEYKKRKQEKTLIFMDQKREILTGEERKDRKQMLLQNIPLNVKQEFKKEYLRRKIKASQLLEDLWNCYCDCLVQESKEEKELY